MNFMQPAVLQPRAAYPLRTLPDGLAPIGLISVSGSDRVLSLFRPFMLWPSLAVISMQEEALCLLAILLALITSPNGTGPVGQPLVRELTITFMRSRFQGTTCM